MQTAWTRMRSQVNRVSSGFKLFDTQTTLSPALSNIVALWKLKQMRNIADDNLFGGLRVNTVLTVRSTFTLLCIFQHLGALLYNPPLPCCVYFSTWGRCWSQHRSWASSRSLWSRSCSSGAVPAALTRPWRSSRLHRRSSLSTGRSARTYRNRPA